MLTFPQPGPLKKKKMTPCETFLFYIFQLLSRVTERTISALSFPRLFTDRLILISEETNSNGRRKQNQAYEERNLSNGEDSNTENNQQLELEEAHYVIVSSTRWRTFKFIVSLLIISTIALITFQAVRLIDGSRKQQKSVGRRVLNFDWTIVAAVVLDCRSFMLLRRIYKCPPPER